MIEKLMQQITDGKPHILNEDYGYVVEMCRSNLIHKICECKRRFMSIYAEYIYSFDRALAIRIIEKHINEHPPHEDAEFIIKPVDSYLSNDSSVAMKFKRRPHDEEFFNA